MPETTGRAKWSQDGYGEGVGVDAAGRLNPSGPGTEYGGVPGLIQPGEHRAVVGDLDAVGEAAMVLRGEARRSAGYDPALIGTADVHSPAVEETFAELATRYSGVRADDIRTEQIDTG